MEYFPYKKEGQAIVIKKQIYESSSDDSRKQDERKTKTVIKQQHKAEMAQKKAERAKNEFSQGRSSVNSSLERCKNLVKQNTKKHHDIWLKGDAIVRVPAALRPAANKTDDRRISKSVASQGSCDMNNLIADIEDKDAPNQEENFVINNGQPIANFQNSQGMSDYFERSGSQCEVLNANNKIETRVDRVSFNTSGNDQNRAKTPRLEASPEIQEQKQYVVEASKQAENQSDIKDPNELTIENQGDQDLKKELFDRTDRESIDAELASRGSDDSIRPAFVKETKLHEHIEVNLDKIRKPSPESRGSRELGPQKHGEVEIEKQVSFVKQGPPAVPLVPKKAQEPNENFQQKKQPHNIIWSQEKFLNYMEKVDDSSVNDSMATKKTLQLNTDDYEQTIKELKIPKEPEVPPIEKLVLNDESQSPVREDEPKIEGDEFQINQVIAVSKKEVKIKEDSPKPKKKQKQSPFKISKQKIPSLQLGITALDKSFAVERQLSSCCCISQRSSAMRSKPRSGLQSQRSSQSRHVCTLNDQMKVSKYYYDIAQKERAAANLNIRSSRQSFRSKRSSIQSVQSGSSSRTYSYRAPKKVIYKSFQKKKSLANPQVNMPQIQSNEIGRESASSGRQQYDSDHYQQINDFELDNMMESQKGNLRNTQSIANMTEKTHVHSGYQNPMLSNSNNQDKLSSIRNMSQHRLATNVNIPILKNRNSKEFNSYTALKIGEIRMNGQVSQTCTEITVGHQENSSQQENNVNYQSKESQMASSQSQFDTTRLNNAKKLVRDGKISQNSQQQNSENSHLNQIAQNNQNFLNSTRNQNLLNTNSSIPQVSNNSPSNNSKQFSLGLPSKMQSQRSSKINSNQDKQVPEQVPEIIVGTHDIAQQTSDVRQKSSNRNPSVKQSLPQSVLIDSAQQTSQRQQSKNEEIGMQTSYRHSPSQIENLGGIAITPKYQSKHQSQPNVPQLNLSDMVMSGSEYARGSSVSKVVAADPNDYLADQSGGNQSSIMIPSKDLNQSNQYVQVLSSNNQINLLTNPSERYDSGKVIVERTNENTQESKDELRSQKFPSSFQLSNRSPKYGVNEQNQQMDAVVYSALDLILKNVFSQVLISQEQTSVTEEKVYDEVIFDAQKFEYDTKSGSQDTMHDSTLVIHNTMAMPQLLIKQQYEIDQIKEMGSADEQSRQVTDREQVTMMTREGSLLKPSKTSEDTNQLVQYQSFTASPKNLDQEPEPNFVVQPLQNPIFIQQKYQIRSPRKYKNILLPSPGPVMSIQANILRQKQIQLSERRVQEPAPQNSMPLLKDANPYADGGPIDTSVNQIKQNQMNLTYTLSDEQKSKTSQRINEESARNVDYQNKKDELRASSSRVNSGRNSNINRQNKTAIESNYNTLNLDLTSGKIVEFDESMHQPDFFGKTKYIAKDKSNRFIIPDNLTKFRSSWNYQDSSSLPQQIRFGMQKQQQRLQSNKDLNGLNQTPSLISEINKNRIRQIQGKFENQHQYYGTKYAGKGKYIGRVSNQQFQTENSRFENIEPEKSLFEAVRASNNTAIAGGQVRVHKLLNTSLGSDEHDEGLIRVNSRFNLKEFVKKYKLEGIWQNDYMANEERFNKQDYSQQLAIHDFHKQEGKMKNKGPDNIKGRLHLNSMNKHSNLQSKNDMIAKSLESERQYQNSTIDYQNQSFTTNDVGATENSARKYQLSMLSRHMKAGIVDIDQAYMLVQCIKKSHGANSLSDTEIRNHAKALGSGSRQRSNSLVKEFKWREVLKFMKHNPVVMVQMLTMFDMQKMTESSIEAAPSTNGEFFNRRPRYTEKILAQIYRGLPGLMGHLNMSTDDHRTIDPSNYSNRMSGMLFDNHQKQRIVSKEQKKYSQLQGWISQDERLMKNSQKRATYKIRYQKKSPLNQKLSPRIHKKQNKKIQDHLNNKSLSPQGIKHVRNARKATDDMNSSRGNPQSQANQQKTRSMKPGASQKNMHMPSDDTMSQSNNNQFSNSIHNISLKTRVTNIKRQTQPQKDASKHTGLTSNHDTSSPIASGTGQNISSMIPALDIPKIEAPSLPQVSNNIHKPHIPPRSQNTASQVRQKYKQVVHKGSDEDTGEVAFHQYASQYGMNQNNHYGGINGPSDEVQMMMMSVDIKKPRTNVRQRRKPNLGIVSQQEQMNAQSAQGAVQEAFPEKPITDVKNGNNHGKLFENDIGLPKVPNRDDGLVENPMVQSVNAKSRLNGIDQRTDLTSGGSLMPSKFEELTKQAFLLKEEESVLSKQRKAVVAEKDKVSRQLRRLDKKEELAAQEEQVRKQRLILEIEKKKLREDISELDQLKQMLEKRKKDTATGFSDLAESNKELRSLKSGDLHGERSLVSRQSQRSKNAYVSQSNYNHGSKMESNVPDGKNGSGTEETVSATYQVAVSQAPPKVMQNDTGFTVADQVPRNLTKNVSKLSHGNEDEDPVVDGSWFSRPSQYQNNSQVLTPERLRNGNQEYQDPPTKDLQLNSRMISSQHQARKSQMDAFRTSFAPNPDMLQVQTNMSKTDVNFKPGRSDKKMLANSGQSPNSISNMTFISGIGVFDWAYSQIMDDVNVGREKFGAILDTGVKLQKRTTSTHVNLYNEQEVFDMIELIKENQKSLRHPDKLQEVYQKSHDTLQELMSQMNQQILFQMIAKKYTDVNLDNTVKLLVRCKQLLQSRALAYQTLKGISKFENNVAEIKKFVDIFLDVTPTESQLSEVKKLSQDLLPKQAQEVINNIAELRDQYKLFSKMGATTSKGHQVLNIMAYKGRDAMRYVCREYDAIKRLIQVVDIQIPAIQKK